jgi:hypothetical protein
MKDLLKRRRLIVAIVVGLILALTNPGEKSFKEFLSEDLKNEAHKDSDVSGAIMDVLSKPAAWIMSLSTERTNLLFFSIYSVTPDDSDYVYIGVLGMFIRID